MTQMRQLAKEMQKYRCHKEVWALKIKTIEFDSDKAKAEGRVDRIVWLNAWLCDFLIYGVVRGAIAN